MKVMKRLGKISQAVFIDKAASYRQRIIITQVILRILNLKYL